MPFRGELLQIGQNLRAILFRVQYKLRNVDEITSTSRRTDLGRICLISDHKSWWNSGLFQYFRDLSLNLRFGKGGLKLWCIVRGVILSTFLKLVAVFSKLDIKLTYKRLIVFTRKNLSALIHNNLLKMAILPISNPIKLLSELPEWDIVFLYFLRFKLEVCDGH